MAISVLGELMYTILHRIPSAHLVSYLKSRHPCKSYMHIRHIYVEKLGTSHRILLQMPHKNRLHRKWKVVAYQYTLALHKKSIHHVTITILIHQTSAFSNFYQLHRAHQCPTRYTRSSIGDKLPIIQPYKYMENFRCLNISLEYTFVQVLNTTGVFSNQNYSS